MNELSDRLKDLIAAKNIPQKELAESIGISPQRLNLYVNGKRTPTLETLRNLADSLNVSVGYLINGYDTLENNERRIELRNRKRDAQIKLLELYKQARNNAEEEVEFLTAEIQDLDIRIKKIEKKLQTESDK